MAELLQVLSAVFPHVPETALSAAFLMFESNVAATTSWLLDNGTFVFECHGS